MIRRELKIGRWKVDFFFMLKKYDTEEVLFHLQRLGASDDILDRVYAVTSANDLNTGFTFTNPDSHKALIVIGPTTSGAEFQDTLVHEIHHLAVAIAHEIGISLDSETPAYISGDSMRALADVICRLGCDR